MAALVIRIKKRPDGSAALSCRRADGTTTWQRQEGVRGAFFPVHDLTHYAVESVLGAAAGFWGLVAAGWNLTDFDTPWPRGPIPLEARATEFLVGMLDQERAGGVEWTARQFDAAAAKHFAEPGAPDVARVSDDQLARIRALRRDLLARWSALPADGALEPEFGGPAAAAHRRD